MNVDDVDAQDGNQGAPQVQQGDGNQRGVPGGVNQGAPQAQGGVPAPGGGNNGGAPVQGGGNQGVNQGNAFQGGGNNGGGNGAINHQGVQQGNHVDAQVTALVAVLNAGEASHGEITVIETAMTEHGLTDPDKVANRLRGMLLEVLVGVAAARHISALAPATTYDKRICHCAILRALLADADREIDYAEAFEKVARAHRKPSADEKSETVLKGVKYARLFDGLYHATTSPDGLQLLNPHFLLTSPASPQHADDALRTLFATYPAHGTYVTRSVATSERLTRRLALLLLARSAECKSIGNNTLMLFPKHLWQSAIDFVIELAVELAGRASGLDARTRMATKLTEARIEQHLNVPLVFSTNIANEYGTAMKRSRDDDPRPTPSTDDLRDEFHKLKATVAQDRSTVAGYFAKAKGGDSKGFRDNPRGTGRR